MLCRKASEDLPDDAHPITGRYWRLSVLIDDRAEQVPSGLSGGNRTIRRNGRDPSIRLSGGNRITLATRRTCIPLRALNEAFSAARADISGMRADPHPQ